MKKPKRSQKTAAEKSQLRAEKLKEIKRNKKKKAFRKLNIFRRKKKKKEEKIFIPNLSLFFALVLFILGIFPAYTYWNQVKYCTSEVRGVIVCEDDDYNTYRYYRKTAAGKYMESGKNGRYWRKIEVETDERFKYETLYAAQYIGQKEDRVLIHYNPDDPDEYYFDGHSTAPAAIVLFSLCGSMLGLSVFLFIYYNKSSRKKKVKHSRR